NLSLGAGLARAAALPARRHRHRGDAAAVLVATTGRTRGGVTGAAAGPAAAAPQAPRSVCAAGGVCAAEPAGAARPRRAGRSAGGVGAPEAAGAAGRSLAARSTSIGLGHRLEAAGGRKRAEAKKRQEQKRTITHRGLRRP